MKRYLILLIGVVVLFSLGVEGCGETDDIEGVERFIGSKEGVSLAFTSGKPLSEFNINDNIPVEVILRNGGEKSIKAGDAKVKLFGLNLDQFSLPSGYIGTGGALHGISVDFPEAGEQRVSFGDLKYKGELLSPQYTQDLRARVCYPYQTLIETKICVGSKRAQERDGDFICDIDGEKLKSGDVSSAPVQVTSISEKLFGSDNVRIILVIKNVGSGKVYSPGDDCDRLGDSDMLNIDINPNDIQCDFGTGELSDRGEIRLVDGAKTLNCRRTVSIDED